MGSCFSAAREAQALLKLDGNKVAKRSFAGQCGHLCKLKSIYDGDTFTIFTRLRKKEVFAEYSIRLSGLDAPEVKPAIKTTPHRELHKQAGIHVRDLLRQWLPEGSILIVDFEKEEKYGRLLGRIWTTRRWMLFWYKRDQDITALLLRKRLALPYEGQCKDTFDEPFLKRCLKVDTLDI